MGDKRSALGHAIPTPAKEGAAINPAVAQAYDREGLRDNLAQEATVFMWF